MATIHLIEGPVGAGKSTYSAQLSLAHHAPHLNLDEWMVTLFSPDRPEQDFLEWYSDRKDRCIQQIWSESCELLNHDISVVLELGLVQRSAREDFYQRVASTDYPLKIHLLNAPLHIRRKRVRDRNEQKTATYQMNVSDEMFELANSFWEPPTDAECSGRELVVIETG